jgi:GAF domain-containing protein
VDETADDAVVDRGFDVDGSSRHLDASVAPSGLPRFASSLRELASRHTVDETLQLAVDLASELVAECDLADVMFWQAGDVTTPVSTDPLAIALDEAQADAGEGPCVLAATGEPVVVVSDLASDGRFPVFGPRAAELGVRSAVSFQLFVDRKHGARLGALNLYGEVPGAFDDEAVALAAVFATHCATVLAAAIAREGFEAALESRDLIGQAKGILMQRHQLTATGAFEQLRTCSQELNVKLREVAEAVVDTGDLP